MKRLLLLFLLLPVLAMAQGAAYSDIIMTTKRGTPTPLTGVPATIRVCTSTATGIPCTPIATIYTSSTLSTVATNPFQTNSQGWYQIFAPAGNYKIQVSGAGIITYTYFVSVPAI